MENAPTKNPDELKKVCHEAYKLYPNACNKSVWHVIKLYKPDQINMMANPLIDYISQSEEWEAVKLSELSTLANKGILVVGGLKEKGHGHVVVVYPGDEKKPGGYLVKDKKTGKMVILNKDESDTYARVMSTSLGTDWPGTMSDGNKTVWDPFGRKFGKVRFWKYIGPKKKEDSKEQKPKKNAEAARINSEMYVINTTPDVCKTPRGRVTVRVPYQIVGNLGDSASISPNVRFADNNAFLLDKSTITKVTGDEAGTRGGVQSGTNISICEPVEGCKTFRVNGKQVVAHGDKFKMNNGNTFGKAVCQVGAAPACGIEDGKPTGDTNPPRKV